MAQRKRAGPITQRSEDRNLPLLYKLGQSASRMFFVQPIRSLRGFLMKVFVTRGINEENFHQALKRNLIGYAKNILDANWSSLYSRGRFRSSDLWVMGPARFRCATLLFIGYQLLFIESNTWSNIVE